MNKKILMVVTLISILFLIGCEKKEQKETSSQYKDLVIEKDPNIEKYYDESRLEKNKSYTFDEAINDFTFILYTNIWEKDQLENDEFIFSYTDTENTELYTGGGNNYSFKYIEDNIYNSEVHINIIDYTKENYKEKLQEINYQIIKEENEYVFMKPSDSKDSYYGLKFFENGTCIKASVTDYSSGTTEEEKENKNITNIKSILETITLDKGYPFLQDKLATIKKFDNKTIISAKYIGGVSVQEKSFNVSNNSNSEIILYVNYKNPNYYTNYKWQILSVENPYIVMNEENTYKVVNKGLPEYYKFEDCRNNEFECQSMGGSLEDFNVLINLFYE